MSLISTGSISLDSAFNPLSNGDLNISELRDLPQPLSVEYLSLSPHQEEEDRNINTSRHPEVRNDSFSCIFTFLDTWFQCFGLLND